MLSPVELYPVVGAWIEALGLSHAVARGALGQLVTALLVGQRLRPSAWMRALASPVAAPRGSATSACGAPGPGPGARRPG